MKISRPPDFLFAALYGYSIGYFMPPHWSWQKCCRCAGLSLISYFVGIAIFRKDGTLRRPQKPSKTEPSKKP